MRIGVDLDGVLTPIGLYNTDTKLPWWCALWLIFVPPNKEMVKKLKKWHNLGHEIIIVSARPPEIENLTRYWLKMSQIPFKELILLGPGRKVGKRKLEIIKKMNILIFIDDDERIIKYIKRNQASVSAILFKQKKRGVI